VLSGTAARLPLAGGVLLFFTTTRRGFSVDASSPLNSRGATQLLLLLLLLLPPRDDDERGLRGAPLPRGGDLDDPATLATAVPAIPTILGIVDRALPPCMMMRSAVHSAREGAGAARAALTPR